MMEPRQIECRECGGTGIVALPTDMTRGVFPPDEAAPPVCPVCEGRRVVAARRAVRPAARPLR